MQIPKNERGKDKKESLPWEDCDGLCINPEGKSCPYVPCEAIVEDWGRLQTILDLIDDINEKVGFLQTLLSRNQFVCYDGKCPIFENIFELRRELADFDIPITSMKKIRTLNLSPLQKKIYSKKYEIAKYKCDLALQEIMKVASVNRAKDEAEETFHRRRLELIDKMNESNFALPVEIKADIEKQLNTSNGIVQWEQKTKEKKKKKSGDKNKNYGGSKA